MFLCAAVFTCLCFGSNAFSQGLFYGGTRFYPRYFARSGPYRRTFSHHDFRQDRSRQVDAKFTPYNPASKQVSRISERQPLNLQPAPDPANNQSTPRPVSAHLPLNLLPLPRPPNFSPAPRPTTVVTTSRLLNLQPPPYPPITHPTYRPAPAPLPLNLLPLPRPPIFQPISRSVQATTGTMPFRQTPLPMNQKSVAQNKSDQDPSASQSNTVPSQRASQSNTVPSQRASPSNTVPSQRASPSNTVPSQRASQSVTSPHQSDKLEVQPIGKVQNVPANSTQVRLGQKEQQHALVIISQNPKVSRQIQKAAEALRQLKAIQSILYYR